MMKTLIRTTVASLLLIAGAVRAEKAHSALQPQGMLKQHVIRLGLDTEFGIPLGNYADANSVGGGKGTVIVWANGHRRVRPD